MKYSMQSGAYIGAAGFVVVCMLLLLWDEPLAYLKLLMAGMGPVSYGAYVALLALAVVFMPLTAMPLIPIASMAFGPFVTSLLSICGWTLGAVGAFLIARHIARPIVGRFVDLERADEFVGTFPPRTRFLMIVLLRLTVPVDLVSYALGLSKQVGLLEYTVATMIGVSWFSFAFSYLGASFVTGDIVHMTVLAAASLLVFLGGWYMLRQHSK